MIKQQLLEQIKGAYFENKVLFCCHRKYSLVLK